MSFKNLSGANTFVEFLMNFENCRLASKSTHYINTIKISYGKFNIRFAAVKVLASP